MAIALLAPVPEEHLLSGLSVCGQEGRVAFGSQSWETFRKLDDLLNGGTCEVLIYASDAVKPLSPPTVTWQATYVGHVISRGGAHPQGMRYRPPTTGKYTSDNVGYWALFWEVENLRPLEASSWIQVAKCKGFEQSKKYIANFIPRGPILIQEPFLLT